MHPDLTRSSAAASRLVWRDESSSTNVELAALAVSDEAAWPDFSVLVTDRQSAGKGRRDRSWVSPAGTSLAISVLLRPVLPVESLGWLPLMAGLAMTRSVRSSLATAGVDASRAQIKWPNDVLVADRKICGVLSELVAVNPGGPAAVVVGAGVNTSMTSDQLPVGTATSLAVEGVADPVADAVLGTYLEELRALYSAFTGARGDATRSGLRRSVADACATLDSQIRVELPGDESLVGTAVDIDADGHLLIRSDAGILTTVSAGDVIHVRR